MDRNKTWVKTSSPLRWSEEKPRHQNLKRPKTTHHRALHRKAENKCLKFLSWIKNMSVHGSNETNMFLTTAKALWS